MSEQEVDKDALLSPIELAKKVGVKISTIRALLRDKRLKHLQISPKVRKITLRSWEAFEQKHTQEEVD